MVCPDVACALLEPVAETLRLGTDSAVALWDNRADS